MRVDLSKVRCPRIESVLKRKDVSWAFFGGDYRDSFFFVLRATSYSGIKLVQHDKPNIILQNERYDEVCCVLMENHSKGWGC